jgi:hypothetical protein
MHIRFSRERKKERKRHYGTVMSFVLEQTKLNFLSLNQMKKKRRRACMKFENHTKKRIVA